MLSRHFFVSKYPFSNLDKSWPDRYTYHTHLGYFIIQIKLRKGEDKLMEREDGCLKSLKFKEYLY